MFWLAIDPALAAEIARLVGHDVDVAPDGLSYVIADVAGEGPPLVGEVERRGDGLWLVRADGPALRLVGALAHPRIAGPGHKVWALGAIDGETLRPRRLGILRTPR